MPDFIIPSPNTEELLGSVKSELSANNNEGLVNFNNIIKTTESKYPANERYPTDLQVTGFDNNISQSESFSPIANVNNTNITNITNHNNIQIIEQMFGSSYEQSEIKSNEQTHKAIDEYILVNNTQEIHIDSKPNTANDNFNYTPSSNFVMIDKFDTEDDPEEVLAFKRQQKMQDELKKKVLQKMELELKIKNQNREKAMEFISKFNRWEFY
jgi:hypothetical protein